MSPVTGLFIRIGQCWLQHSQEDQLIRDTTSKMLREGSFTPAAIHKVEGTCAIHIDLKPVPPCHASLAWNSQVTRNLIGTLEPWNLPELAHLHALFVVSFSHGSEITN
jgi:hypothetical protein